MIRPLLKLDSLPSSIQLRIVALAIVQIILLFLMGTALDILIFGGATSGFPIRFLMLALLVWQAQKSRVALLFFAMLISLAIREPTEFKDRHWVGSIFYSVIALSTLSWISRYGMIRNAIAAQVVGFFTEPTDSDSPPNDSLVAKFATSQPEILAHAQTIGRKSVQILLSIFVVSMAAMLIYFQPLSVNESPWLDWATNEHQVLWPWPSLIVLAIGIVIALNELFWRRKTESQFRLLVRSIMIRSLYPDFLRIVRLQCKQKPQSEPSDRSNTSR